MANGNHYGTIEGESIIISVRYYAMVRKSAGMSEETLTFNAGSKITFREVIHRLCERHEDGFKKMLIDSDGEPSRFLVMYFNGEPIWGERRNDFISHSGDLAIYSPVGGG